MSPRRSRTRHDRPDGDSRERPPFRSFWSGTITFGLVSVPVDLYPAHRPGGVSLRMLGPDGVPLSRRYWCPAEEKPLDSDEIVRGYEVEEGEFVVVTDDELESIEPRKSRDIDLRRFVPRVSVDPRYFRRGYVLTPAGESGKAYRLLAEVMESTGRAGIATFVMRGKEYLVAIIADGGILRAETLRFHDELRSAGDVGLAAPERPAKGDVRRMEKEIASLAADGLEARELVDRHAERLLEMVHEKKKRGRDVVEAPEAGEAEAEERAEVIDLMDVLKRSLEGADGGRRRPPMNGGRAAGAGRSRPGRTRHRASPSRSGLEKASKEQLYERAKKLDIPGRSRMSRSALIDAIRKSA